MDTEGERARLLGPVARHARDAFVIAEGNGRVIEANEAAVAMYGYPMAELRGLSLGQFRDPAVPLDLPALLQEAARPGGTLYQTRHRRRDGTVFPVEISAAMVDLDGKPCLLASVRDITPRVQSEERLRESEERFRRLVQDLPNIAVQGYDAQRRVTFWNAASESLYGYTAEEALGWQLEDLIIPAPMREDVIAGVSAWVEGGPPIPPGELVLRRKDGTPVEVFSSHVMLENARGEREMHCIDIDLTGRRQAETELRQNEARFRGMLEQNIAAIFMVEDGRITFANRRIEEILGYPPGGLLGREALALIEPGDRERIGAQLQALACGAIETAAENFGAVRLDGSRAEIGCHAVLAHLHGKPAVIGMAREIGERLKAERRIQSYIAQLERSMESTLEAVSQMVELRDPYTAGHEHRVGDLSAAIGRELGLDASMVKGLGVTGHVHDVGKICAPAELLTKHGRLNPHEFDLIKQHSQAGHDVLCKVEFPWPVAKAVLQHHERLDGSGYPNGLKGDEILLEARIIAVADVVEAMASHRPYRAGLGLEVALAEITRNAGRLYDAAVVTACVRLFRTRGYALPA